MWAWKHFNEVLNICYGLPPFFCDRNTMERHAACHRSIQICLHQSAASFQSCRKTGAHCSSCLGGAMRLWQLHTRYISFVQTCTSWSSGWQRPSNAWVHQNFLPPAQRQRPCWNCTRNARYWENYDYVAQWEECAYGYNLWLANLPCNICLKAITQKCIVIVVACWEGEWQSICKHCYMKLWKL